MRRRCASRHSNAGPSAPKARSAPGGIGTTLGTTSLPGSNQLRSLAFGQPGPGHPCHMNGHWQRQITYDALPGDQPQRPRRASASMTRILAATLVALASVLVLDACEGPRWGLVVSTAQMVVMAPTGAQPVPGSGSGAAAWELAVMNLDASGIAFLSTRDRAPGQGGPALWVMKADGSGAHEIGHPSGGNLDIVWGDIAWSRQDWLLFVVAETGTSGTCFKTRLDKTRPDGTQRTQVTDGGPNCTPPGMEQSGDADPGFSANGATIYTSRGFPYSPPGMPGATVRKLYMVSSDAWYAGKPERDLSLARAPDCIEGVPKVSPDGARILLFRACAGERAGVTVTDTAGSYRTWIADGFGPDWNPAGTP